jgi:hypothetical protein
MHTLIQLSIKFDHTMWDRHKAYKSDRTSDQTGKKIFRELCFTRKCNVVRMDFLASNEAFYW